MSPRVTWARGCQSEALDPIVEPQDLCVPLQIDRADFSIGSSLGGAINAKVMFAFDTEITSDYALRDNS